MKVSETTSGTITIMATNSVMEANGKKATWIPMETEEEQLVLLKRIVESDWVLGTVSLGCKLILTDPPSSAD